MKLMNFSNKLLLLTTLLYASDISCGPKMLSKRNREESTYVIPSAKKHCSGVESESEDGCVSIDSDGVVTIKREKYPKFSGKQNVVVRPRIVSELMFDERRGLPYHFVEFDNRKEKVKTTNNETIIDESSQFDIISPEKIQEKPYSSVGRLDMLYKKDGKSIFYHGSGAAIDTDCIITAAHNIHDEDDGIADTVYFKHMLTGADKLNCSEVSTKHFVHPKWKDNFAEKYDIALVFLSESLNLTEVQIENLLKLQIF